MPSWSNPAAEADEPFAFTLGREVVDHSVAQVERLWRARREGRLSNADFEILGLTLTATSEFFCNLVVATDAPLKDLRSDEIADGAPVVSWLTLLSLTLHALQQFTRQHSDVGLHTDDLVGKLCCELDLDEAAMTETLAMLGQGSERGPMARYALALNGFHQGLLGTNIGERDLPQTLGQDDADILSAFPPRTYYLHLYMRAWEDFHEALAERFSSLPTDLTKG